MTEVPLPGEETEPGPLPPLGLAPDGTVYEYDAEMQMLDHVESDGVLIESWPYATEEEAAAYVASLYTTARDNRQQMLDFMAASRASNDLFTDMPNNTIVLIDVVRQVKDLTRQSNRMMRLWTNDLDGVD